ncbi:uncharacterized protein LOC117125239 [Anneissia japonica]|uniref:uncharacterized protein LOC117125239 n=1 Tax=Anneissia japonica TaxID=1529436 RepID=UPI00142572B7|nr:uncharacterized protein LOC117125239 [Anneissia japonica]
MQELMIQQKKADMELQMEINAAEAARQIYEEEGSETNQQMQDLNPPQLVGNSYETPHQSVPYAIEREPELTSSSNPMFWRLAEKPPAQIFQPFDLDAPQWRTQPSMQQNAMELLASKMMEAQDRQSNALLKTVQQQQSSVTALTLPNPSMKVYSGNPVDYCEFVTAFRHLVENKTTNQSARLHYLIQYTSGTVQELMRSCLSMSDERGYLEARRLLQERYGQPHKVAAAHLQRLLDWPIIKPEDGPALQRFSTQLTSCTNTLEEIGYLGKLDNPENLRKIIERLPYRLRVKWREIVDTIIEREKRDVTIKDITKLVTDKARLATHPVFGKLSDPIPKSTTNVSRPKQPSHKQSHSYAIQGQSDNEKLKCVLRGEEHWLSRCEAFKRMTLNERWKIVKEKKICNNCLTIGHFVRLCPKESFCKIDGCKTKHSTFLHPKEQQANSAGIIVHKEPKHQPHKEITDVNKVSMTATRNTSAVTGLAALPVRVKAAGSSRVVETYAFLDNGSNTTFCTNSLLKQLGVKTDKINLSSTTINGVNRPVKCELASLEIFDLDHQNSVKLPTVYSIQSLPISMNTVATSEDVNRWPHLNGIEVQKINADIGILIGSDVPELL